MRLLHTSDWHLGKNLFSFSMLEDQHLIVRQILELIEEKQIDAVVIAGDVYDRPVPPVGAMELYDFFLTRAVLELGVPVLSIAGNHDSAGRLEFGSGLYRGSGYHVAGRVAMPAHKITLTDAYGPVHFHLLPYLHPADVRAIYPEAGARTFDDAWRALLSTIRLNPEERNVAVAHGFFAALAPDAAARAILTSDSEVSVGGMDIADSALFAAFDYTALGHLHAPQRAGGDTVRYSGTPLKYSLSEREQQKSVTVVELGEKGQVSAQAVPLTPRRDVRVVSGSLDFLLEPANHQNKHFDDYVFAELEDESVLYPMEKLRTLLPNLLGLRLHAREETAAALPTGPGTRKRLTEEDLFRRFYLEIKGEDIPPRALEIFKEAKTQSRQEEEVNP